MRPFCGKSYKIPNNQTIFKGSGTICLLALLWSLSHPLYAKSTHRSAAHVQKLPTLTITAKAQRPHFSFTQGKTSLRADHVLILPPHFNDRILHDANEF